MSQFAVDKNVPLPERINPRGRGPKYPFDEMSIGDSFFVPEADELKRERAYHTVAQYARNKRLSWARNGQKYSIRKLPDGVRVWRVA